MAKVKRVSPEGFHEWLSAALSYGGEESFVQWSIFKMGPYRDFVERRSTPSTFFAELGKVLLEHSRNNRPAIETREDRLVVEYHNPTAVFQIGVRKNDILVEGEADSDDDTNPLVRWCQDSDADFSEWLSTPRRKDQ